MLKNVKIFVFFMILQNFILFINKQNINDKNSNKKDGELHYR